MDTYTKQLVASLLLELSHRKNNPLDAAPVHIFPTRPNGMGGSSDHTDAKIREIVFGDSMTSNESLIQIVKGQ
jgi:hypothetical protein